MAERTPLGQMLIEVEADNLQGLIQIREMYVKTLESIDQQIFEIETKEIREAFKLLHDSGYDVQRLQIGCAKAWMQNGEVRVEVKDPDRFPF